MVSNAQMTDGMSRDPVRADVLVAIELLERDLEPYDDESYEVNPNHWYVVEATYKLVNCIKDHMNDVEWAEEWWNWWFSHASESTWESNREWSDFVMKYAKRRGKLIDFIKNM